MKTLILLLANVAVLPGQARLCLLRRSAADSASNFSAITGSSGQCDRAGEEPARSLSVAHCRPDPRYSQ